MSTGTRFFIGKICNIAKKIFKYFRIIQKFKLNDILVFLQKNSVKNKCKTDFIK